MPFDLAWSTVVGNSGKCVVRLAICFCVPLASDGFWTACGDNCGCLWRQLRISPNAPDFGDGFRGYIDYRPRILRHSSFPRVDASCHLAAACALFALFLLGRGVAKLSWWFRWGISDEEVLDFRSQVFRLGSYMPFYSTEFGRICRSFCRVCWALCVAI